MTLEVGGEKIETPTLSTGAASTLGNWYDLSAAFFGPESKATLFLKEKLDAQGRDEPVLANEGQLIMALAQMDMGASEESPKL
jgi:hypothetical protein